MEDAYAKKEWLFRVDFTLVEACFCKRCSATVYDVMMARRTVEDARE
jgi:hypothetical protein